MQAMIQSDASTAPFVTSLRSKRFDNLTVMVYHDS